MERTLPANVAEAYSALPDSVRAKLLPIRQLVFDVAGETEGVGSLTETLRWGEPAYLTEATGSGSTIRLGWPKAHPECVAIYFNCNTSLVSSFREMFSEKVEFSGNRALLLPISEPIPKDIVSLCIGMALTYQKRRSA